MPIYQFCCGVCGYKIEIRQGMLDDKPKTCSKCGGQLEQVFFPYAIFIGKAPQSFHRKFAYPHHDAKKP